MAAKTIKHRPLRPQTRKHVRVYNVRKNNKKYTAEMKKYDALEKKYFTIKKKLATDKTLTAKEKAALKKQLKTAYDKAAYQLEKVTAIGVNNKKIQKTYDKRELPRYLKKNFVNSAKLYREFRKYN